MICIYVPRHVGVAEIDEEPAESDQLLAHSGDSQTVLVVDDEPLVRMIMVEQLEELGYAVLEADDAPSALRILESSKAINLLVTDVGLPGG
jgi:response regulator RpfG family c-di-GMP phosphodiesterase